MHTINATSSPISDQIERFNDRLESMIMEAFRVRGFPKEWILKNANRVTVREIKNTSYREEAIYSVDNADLFRVIITSTFDDNRFVINYHVKIESCKFKTPT